MRGEARSLFWQVAAHERIDHHNIRTRVPLSQVRQQSLLQHRLQHRSQVLVHRLTVLDNRRMERGLAVDSVELRVEAHGCARRREHRIERLLVKEASAQQQLTIADRGDSLAAMLTIEGLVLLRKGFGEHHRWSCEVATVEAR